MADYQLTLDGMYDTTTLKNTLSLMNYTELKNIDEAIPYEIVEMYSIDYGDINVSVAAIVNDGEYVVGIKDTSVVNSKVLSSHIFMYKHPIKISDMENSKNIISKIRGRV